MAKPKTESGSFLKLLGLSLAHYSPLANLITSFFILSASVLISFTLTHNFTQLVLPLFLFAAGVFVLNIDARRSKGLLARVVTIFFSLFWALVYCVAMLMLTQQNKYQKWFSVSEFWVIWCVLASLVISNLCMFDLKMRCRHEKAGDGKTD